MSEYRTAEDWRDAVEDAEAVASEAVAFKVRRCERCDDEVAVLEGEAFGGYCADCTVIDRIKESLRAALTYWTDGAGLDPAEHAKMAKARQVAEDALML